MSLSPIFLMKERARSKVRLRTHRTRCALLGVALSLTATVVASPPIPKTPVTPVVPAAKAPHRWLQIGKASWYGGKFNGRKTANGERFDMNALTCAHRYLPLGSWVRVTNLHNKKTVFLRVNDRGPMAESLIVDLSYAAAKALGINGLGKVKIEEVRSNDVQMAQLMVASLPPVDRPIGPIAKGIGR